MKPTVPGSGRVAANVAFIRISGSVLMTPMQFGPTIRMPAARTRSFSSCSRRSPSPPTSRKPAVITTSPRTCRATASSTTRAAVPFGTTMTARSTGSGMSRRLAWHLIEWTDAAFGFTG